MEKIDIGKTTWIDRFGNAYKTKWKALGKSQQMFADEVNRVRTRNENGTIGTVTGQQVSKWLHGSIPELNNLEAICEVLDLDSNYFLPNREEKYRDSSKYITDLGRTTVKFSNEIGLDLNYLKAVHTLVDLDNLFPLYSPIVEDRTDIIPMYERLTSFGDSAPIDEELSFLQINRDGKNITLHICDLAFLRDVQDQVIEFVKYLFYKRHEEMHREVEEVNRRTHGELTNGEKAFIPISDYDIYKIDRYYKYAGITLDDINQYRSETGHIDDGAISLPDFWSWWEKRASKRAKERKRHGND